MKKSQLLGAVCACLAIVSINANAVVQNTLNGVTYEWFELTETFGLNRDQVELRLADTNDVLYGYEYASRSLVQDLLLSYSSFDGLNGYHGDTSAVSGGHAFQADFGIGESATYDIAPNQYALNTVDGYLIRYIEYHTTEFIYGTSSECEIAGHPVTYSCHASTSVLYDINGEPTASSQREEFGYDDQYAPPSVIWDGYEHPSQRQGSLLYRTSTVPVPASLWLFGSGLLGLIGVARRKAA